MKENWKDVVGYEGLYKISNLGNLKSLDGVRKNASSKRIRVQVSHEKKEKEEA